MSTRNSHVTSAADLAEAILALPPRQPFTDEFDRRWVAAGRKPHKKPWYRDDKEYLPECCEQQRHWCGYMAATCEEFDADHKPYPSAEQLYMRVHNPLMLSYLAEASGIPLSVVTKAADAALAAKSTPAKAKAFRQVIPWKVIESALCGRRIDCAG